MRLAVATLPDGRRQLGRVEGDAFQALVDSPAHQRRDVLADAIAAKVDLARLDPIAGPVPLSTVALRSPLLLPQKIVCVGLNYADHVRESGMEFPTAPLIFAKFPNALLGHGDQLTYDPATTAQLDYEAELAVVIGTQARSVSEDDALDHVFGYTCANDVSARDVQLGDGQWVRGKSFDGFCPLGPWVVTKDEIPDPQLLSISLKVNGELLQDSTTKEMIFGIAEIISYLSRTMTLEPGDLILTGTPYGVGMGRNPQRWLVDGDAMEVIIEGIGTLSNVVSAAPRS